MNCTEVFNYIFESFNSNNIDYAIIHSYQYLPDRFDSDIDTAINVPNIKDAIKLLDDTLVGTGWRVIQFWRHENYAADCVISNDDEFLQVDFCTHYERSDANAKKVFEEGVIVATRNGVPRGIAVFRGKYKGIRLKLINGIKNQKKLWGFLYTLKNKRNCSKKYFI